MRALLLLLFVFGALLGLSEQATAAVVTKTGDICIEIDTYFTDLAGDNWVVNQARPARGVKIQIIDAVTTHNEFLSDVTGCLDDYPIQAEQNGGTITLRVHTSARVNGVDMESWSGANTGTAQSLWVTWNLLSTGTGTTFSTTRTISSLDQRWINLAVGTMVFRLYDWNVEQGNDRDCCLDSSTGYDTDGTCPNPASGGYTLITTPIQMQADPSYGCCASFVVGSGSPPGVRTGTDVPYKFSIAHEMGHVIARMRMGGREVTSNIVSEDGCNGDYDLDYTQVSLNDRGEFTKEAWSSLRESWGNFVSAIAWNSRGQADCEFQVIYRHFDFDLDNVGSAGIDSDRTGGDLDGAYDCEGIPSLPGDPALESYVTSENWLGNLVDADDDGVDGVQCERYVWQGSTVIESYDRTTVFDGTRFFWDVTTDRGVHPDDMSDVYVDMCPRSWQPGNGLFTFDDDMPYYRLDISANHHHLGEEFVDEAFIHLVH